MPSSFSPATSYPIKTHPEKEVVMRYLDLRGIRLLLPLVVFGVCLFAAVEIDAQGTRRRTSTPIPAPTATPSTSEPLIISRADEFPDENPQAIPPDPNATRPTVDAASLLTLEEL